MIKHSIQECEHLRQQAKIRFDPIRHTWCELLRWTLPHRAAFILSQTEGERKNQHIVDPTHILGLRSYQAGFLEGNTSASRPWYRISSKDVNTLDNHENKTWLQHYTQRTLSYLGSSNYYHAAGVFYNDYGTVNTGAHYFEELDPLGIHVHTLIPGSYFVLDDSYGRAGCLIREFSLNVKSVVETYGKRDSRTGKYMWDNISDFTKRMYEESNYSEMIDIVHVIRKNPNYDINDPDHPDSREWLELTYELGTGTQSFWQGSEFNYNFNRYNDDIFLKVHTRRRKPFVVGKSTEGYEYGEKGPTLDSLGLIKSLNKKAISKDQAIEQILHPALQGPSSLRKSYISHSPNTFVPLDAKSISSKQKLEPIFQVNPAIGTLLQDVDDMRRTVEKLYYADFLLFLSRNPKTRTATEAAAVVEEQQRIIGPNLQSLNYTYNSVVLDWIMDYVLYEDPYLRPPPEDLQGKSLQPEFVSVFAQAQKAADLPAIDRYVAMVGQVGQLDPKILQKINVDKLADLYEDRLYLPSGLNNPQGKVDAMREQAQAEAQRQQMMQQNIPAMAKAAKDISSIDQQQPE